ncbi:TetR/AcrR family transcriptional regulator C-terminal domain-containing protein [Spongiactinospora sp. TRM90649]|uniref:TetR/AcrR family transcriptional regulator n=1 Tax=Spongiactinospora sp. TRM90649 TaxID=3031114 RepID=UPI0023F76711|nr:TetR/AcrR family transcriptional regulator C-terminal domain-containing protein [Spongiactinospora sp. TRM90649]MDF5752348.1 TetR/AcrR family transcriptional regulator C-terminal domain-containing protein [Spongiactinospora sp. TRM90649]
MNEQAEAVPVPPWRTPRKTPAARRPLSQDAIVDAGLRVLDAEGLDALSMRRVAQELGTGPASLYAHVANKDELLDLLYDRVLGEVETPEADPERWLEQMRELAVHIFDVLGAHADIAKVAIANIPSGPNALRVAEAEMAIMIKGGVPPRIASWMLDRLNLYIAADVYEGALYQARRRASGKDIGDFMHDYFAQIGDYYRTLPKDRFPMMAGHVDDLLEGGGNVRFEFGLDLLLSGLARFAGPRPEA